jgi:hypothetical protein
MDFNDPDWIREFANMDADERHEALNDWLAHIAEPFMSDSVDDVLARSMVGAMRSMIEGAHKLAEMKEDGGDPPNAYIMGVWMHAYIRLCKDFQALDGISGIKRSLKKDGE